MGEDPIHYYWTDDHLVPPISAFAWKSLAPSDEASLKALRECEPVARGERSLVMRTVVLPSFSRRWMISVWQTGNAYEVEYVAPAGRVDNTRLAAQSCDHARAELDPVTIEPVLAAFRAMIDRTAAGQPELMVMDGTRYVFSSNGRSGEARTPREGTTVAKTAEIAEILGSIARSASKEERELLRKDLTAASRDLKESLDRASTKH